MKKIISLCFASVFMCFTMNAQEANSNSNEVVEKKECVPTKECAEKMGISLEACKKLCASKTSKTAEASAANTNVHKVVLADGAQTSKVGSKLCCSSIEECAKKLGITVEECLKRCQENCKSGAKASTTTKVASAIMVSEAPAKEVKANCAPAAKSACCSSKKSKN